jgi:beta-lactamase regulating signal transducer with metallopeptidase domain
MHTLLQMGLGNAVTAGAVALVAFSVSRVCRRRPAFIHCLWLVVFLKLLTPPLVGVRLPWTLAWQDDDTAVVQAGTAADSAAEECPPATDLMLVPADEEGPPAEPEAPTVAPQPAPAPPPPPARVPWAWEEAVGLVWLAGSLFWFGWIAWQIGRFRRVLRRAWLAPADVQQQARALADRLGLRFCPAVWLVPGSVSPMLWSAGWSARLLFPAGLLGCLAEDERASLLAHELAHLRRRDHWVRLLELVAIGLYWWHPVVWWARRELHEVEEQCCDAWAVWALRGAGRLYAHALLQTVEFFSRSRSALPLAASGIGAVPHLRRRLVMIVQGTTPRSLSRLGGLATLGLGALLMLPTLPLDAQAPSKPEPTGDEKALQERQQKLQAELEKVQSELKRRQAAKAQKAVESYRRVDEVAQPEKVYRWRVVDVEQLKAQADKLPPDLRQALAEVEQARAHLQAAEQKLRDTLKRSGAQWGERYTVPGKELTPKDLKPLNKTDVRYWSEIKRNAPSQEERLRSLEKRLEELQRAIERMERGQRQKSGPEEKGSSKLVD